MSYVRVGDASLWIEQTGQGSRFILSSAMAFGAYPAILAEPPACRHVVTIQARGFGRSTHLQRPPELGWLEQWSQDVIAVADHLGIERFVYTGISHGGGIGWHLARRYPERLEALVSVVGTPHDRSGDTSSSAGRRKIVANPRDPRVLREQFAILAGRSDTPEQAAARERLVAAAVDAALARSDEENRINQGMPFPEATSNDELAEILATIRVPVLVVAAMRDGVISPASALRAVTAVRGAKGVFYEEEGHMVAGEHPERLARDVELFLREVDEATGRTAR